MDRLTPARQKIVDFLADGEGHTVQELFQFIPSFDPNEWAAAKNALGQQIFHINKYLEKRGQKIVLEYRGGYRAKLYRRVRLLGRAGD